MNLPALSLALVLPLLSVPLAAQNAPPGESDELLVDRLFKYSWPNLAGSGADVRAGALLRTFLHYTDSTLLGSDDFELDLEDADLHVDVGIGSLALRAALDLSDGSNKVEDAYARWDVSPELAVTVGRFRPRVLFSSTMDPEHLAFRERTALGAFHDEFDNGLEVSYRYDQFSMSAAVVDGGDDELADSRYVGRVEWALYDDFWSPSETLRDAPNHLRMLLGGVYVHDDSRGGSGDDREVGGDAALSFGPWGCGFEWLSLDGGAGGKIDDVVDDILAFRPDSDPLAFTLSRAVGERFVVAGRYQDLDDAADTRTYGLAVRHFPFGRGSSAASVLFDITGYDRAGPNGAVAQIGLVLGGSRD